MRSFRLFLGMAIALVSVACSSKDETRAASGAGGGEAGTGGSGGALHDAGPGDGRADAGGTGGAATYPDAPELSGGLGWLNVEDPLTLDELAGHVVLLDFWTFGCVNCIHIIPVLRELEEHFAGQPFVTIGVHSAKFESEEDPDKILLAVQHYDVQHPVLVDQNRAIAREYGASAWPYLILLDPQGRIRFRHAGEFSFQGMAAQIQTLLDEGEGDGTLTSTPLDYLVDPNASASTPLLFPTKLTVLPDDRLVITDSSHHRLVVANPDGSVDAIIGTGLQGMADGTFTSAAFSRPQGTTWHNGLLYIADTENHQLRVADLTAETVTTVAGIGGRGTSRHVVEDSWLPALTTDLRSPWALEPTTEGIVVAMAGSHQIWLFDPPGSQLRVFAGTAGEGIANGAASASTFSQPSGLALSPDGSTIYIADSEASAVRSLDVATAETSTIVGTGLFDYGDIDGVGDAVRLEHVVGIETLADGTVLLADTYNSKLKQLIPAERRVTTLPWPGSGITLDSPQGLARSGDTLYIADTNNHRIVRYDIALDTATVFDLPGLSAPGAP